MTDFDPAGSTTASSNNEQPKGKARTSKNKLVYVAFAAIAAAVVAILPLINAGPRLDASARLDQVTIRYPSSWTYNSDDKSIYVDEADVHAGLVLWSTNGDHFGSKGGRAFLSGPRGGCRLQGRAGQRKD